VCSGRVCSSCYTSGTCRVSLGKNQATSNMKGQVCDIELLTFLNCSATSKLDMVILLVNVNTQVVNENYLNNLL